MCQPACDAAVDCCGAIDELPPGIVCPGPFPYNFKCESGVCDVVPCTGDAECQAAFSGALCLEVDGAYRCELGCASDRDCSPTQSCTGSSGGQMYCESSGINDPFDCESDADCELDGWGRCIDGRCGCTSDADCPPDAACPPA